ncbi:MAG: hypothetical protein EOO77_38685 [Oxalobacteraceae bacterium]|nr:MAG: hypothetical protein EOO77_38685 [Oxalobacteraceae bacterium]
MKGGRCDYGEQHSKKHDHARHGTTHAQGLYENWSEAYPLHFVGHSFGGATIFHLQQLLGKELAGSPSMLKSVVTISSPLRGTPLASSFGQLDGPKAGQKRFSPGWVLASLVHVARTANGVTKDFYDFGNDHWSRPATADGEEEAAAAAARSKYGVVDSFCDYLAGRSVGFSPDSACYDMLLNTMDQHNATSELCDKTYYRSYTASTVKSTSLPKSG